MKGIIPREFYGDAAKIISEVDRLSRKDILNKYLSFQSRTVVIEPYTHKKYLVKTEAYEAVRRGYIAPSMFVKYRRCARELAIELMQMKKLGGLLVSVGQLKSLIRGVLVHKLYFEKYATGNVEVKVESDKHRIVGFIDEVKDFNERYVLIELKSSYNTDIVGAGLQLMSYIYAFSDQEDISLNNVKGYLVTMNGTYEIVPDRNLFDEYKKRLLKIVDIATRGNLENLPPRLPLKLEHRCKTCSYRGQCLTLPDKYRSYSRFFDAMNLKKHRQNERGKLFSYI